MPSLIAWCRRSRAACMPSRRMSWNSIAQFPDCAPNCCAPDRSPPPFGRSGPGPLRDPRSKGSGVGFIVWSPHWPRILGGAASTSAWALGQLRLKPDGCSRGWQPRRSHRARRPRSAARGNAEGSRCRAGNPRRTRACARCRAARHGSTCRGRRSRHPREGADARHRQVAVARGAGRGQACASALLREAPKTCRRQRGKMRKRCSG